MCVHGSGRSPLCVPSPDPWPVVSIGDLETAERLTEHCWLAAVFCFYLQVEFFLSLCFHLERLFTIWDCCWDSICKIWHKGVILPEHHPELRKEYLFLRGNWLTSLLTKHDEDRWQWLSLPKLTWCCMQGAYVFSMHMLSWVCGSGFRIIFQSSTTSMSQPWHSIATVSDWQGSTFDCHVRYSTEFLIAGCHLGSPSTGIVVLSVWMWAYVCKHTSIPFVIQMHIPVYAHRCVSVSVCRQFK